MHHHHTFIENTTYNWAEICWSWTNLKNVEAEHTNKLIITATDKHETLFPDVRLTTELSQ